MAALDLDEFAVAIPALSRAVALGSGRADAWEMLGYTLIRIGRTKDGIAAVDRALRLDPMRTTAHLALAKVYALEGRDDLARQHAEIASGKNPAQGNEAPTTALPWLRMSTMESPPSFCARAAPSFALLTISLPRRLGSSFETLR